ncbi:MAG TPA: hypothetical protein V6C81_04235 [Planktothrix sp.]|jgi:hypothetical protein
MKDETEEDQAMSKQIDGIRANSSRTRMTTWLCAALFLMLDTGALTLSAPPAKADSEAASESGTETGAYGRRRRRMYRMQQMQQRRTENQHEQQVRQSTARQDQYMRKLKPNQVVHNYNFGRSRGQNATQSSQSQPTSAPQSRTP